MTSIDPYSDPWPEDNDALIDAFTDHINRCSNDVERCNEAYDWALGAIVNRRDEVFVRAVKDCSKEKIVPVLEEACREKYIFAALHLADQLPSNIDNHIQQAAQTGSLQLIEKVVGDQPISEGIRKNILTGALKGDCWEIIEQYYPNGVTHMHQAAVRFAARHNAVRCLRNLVTQPLKAQDWEFAIEYAFKDFGWQSIEFLWENPPQEPHQTSVAAYALNIAQRLIETSFPRLNSRAFECLRICMRFVDWEDFETAERKNPIFTQHCSLLFQLNEEPRNHKLNARLRKHIGVSQNTHSRKM